MVVTPSGSWWLNTDVLSVFNNTLEPNKFNSCLCDKNNSDHISFQRSIEANVINLHIDCMQLNMGQYFGAELALISESKSCVSLPHLRVILSRRKKLHPLLGI